MSTTQRKYDVYLSFRGRDTRRNFVSYLYRELARSNIRTFKDDKELESGENISPELTRAVEQSRFAVVVVSVNYAASRWCLDELVKIMDLEENGLIKVLPIFYGVEPSHVRYQIGEIAKQLMKHEGEDLEKVLSWRQALTNLSNISGYCSHNWDDDSEMIIEITDRISKWVLIANPRLSGSELEGIDGLMEALYKLLDLNANESVRVFGIWARGGNSRSVLAKFVYENISLNFDSHFFIESPKNISQDQPQISQDRHMPHPPEEFLKWNQQQISQDRHMTHLQEEFLIWIQGQGLTLAGSESQPVDQDRAKNPVLQIKPTFRNQKVLLVADDVNKLEQIDALAEDFNNFGPGSIVIITTQDKQLLNSANIKLVYDVDLPRFKIPEVRTLFRQLAFNKRDISATLFKEKKWLG